MRLSTYVYPWDLSKLGTTVVLEDLAEQGFSSIDLAANYHAIGAFSPRGPNPNVYLSPRGGLFYPARRECFEGRVQPYSDCSSSITDAWTLANAAANTYGLYLNAWTIGMFQPWMAQLYPSTALVFATGDASDVTVCPANLDVIQFFTEMVLDITEQFTIREVRLEGVGFPPPQYGWVRSRFLTPLSDSGQWNMSLCFCEYCASHARELNIDVASLRKRTLERVSVAMGHRSKPEPPNWLDLQFEVDPELKRFVDAAEQSVGNFVLRVGRAAASNGAGTWISTPVEFNGARGAPLQNVLEVLTGAMARPTTTDLQVEWSTIRAAARRAERTISITAVVPNVFPRLGRYVNPVSRGELAKLEKLTALGPDEILIYHYGLLEPKVFRTLSRHILQMAARHGGSADVTGGRNG